MIEKLIKILLVMTYFSITISLIIAYDHPAVDYESSIYNSTPYPVWILLIFSIVSSMSILIYGTYKNKNYQTLASLVALITSVIIIVSLNNIRGYYLWNAAGDAGTHYGWVKDIISSGHIGYNNIYPILHVLSAQTSILANIDPVYIYKWFPATFCILYFSFIYLAALSLLPTKNHAIIAAITGTILVNCWYTSYSPYGLSLLFFPVALYITGKCLNVNKLPWILLYIIMAILYTFFHPVSPLIFLLLSLAFIVCKIISTRNFHLSNGYNYSLFLIIFTLSWMSMFNAFYSQLGLIKKIIDPSSSAAGSTSNLGSMLADFNYASNKGFNILQYLFLNYSTLSIYGFLTVLTIFYMFIYKVKSNNLKAIIFYLVSLMMVTLVLFMLNLSFSPTRLFAYIILLGNIPAGYLLYEFITLSKNKIVINKLIPIIILSLLILLSIIGIFTIYPSPITYSISDQTTYSEVQGIKWLFDDKSQSIPYTSWYFIPHFYAEFIYSRGDKNYYRRDLSAYANVIAFPDHFGYNNNTSLSSHYDENRYLLITDKIKKMYSEIYPRMAVDRLMPNDLIQLDVDSSLYKIYTNKGFQAWFVNV
ncbi:MAG: hypothetical protein ACM3NG_00205 [Candidatus Doudnabacteria bacterium]